jgi:hypothetical protein
MEMLRRGWIIGTGPGHGTAAPQAHGANPAKWTSARPLHSKEQPGTNESIYKRSFGIVRIGDELEAPMGISRNFLIKRRDIDLMSRLMHLYLNAAFQLPEKRGDTLRTP